MVLTFLSSLAGFLAIDLSEIWEQYLSGAAGMAAIALLVLLQGLLIGLLLVARARRKRASDAMQAAARVFETTGEVFFRSLTDHLNSILQVDYVSIGELIDSGKRMKTVAVTADGKNLENLEYDLEHTPCEQVLSRGNYFDLSDVQAHFPKDIFLVELSVQSYLGVALVDSSGSRIGVMSVMSRHSVKDSKIAELTLSLFAARTSVEMDRRRAERALRASEARNQAFLKAFPDDMLVLDRAGKILDCSAHDHNGLFSPSEHAVGRQIADALPPHAAQEVVLGMATTADSGAPSSVEFSLSKEDAKAYYEARFVPFDSDMVLTILQNVTSRKRVETELDSNRRFFEQIARTMPGVLFVYDLAKRCNTYVNQGGWGLLGYTDEEVIEMGDTFLPRLLHPDDLARLPDLAVQYTTGAKGEIFKHVFRMRHKNGEWRFVLRHATVFARTADGGPSELIGTAIDITDLKKAEEELQQLSGRILIAQQVERRRIARELHDGTSQNLFALTLNLKQLERPGVPAATTTKILAECHRLCEESLKEIRTLSYLLHPPMLDQEGLVAAVQWFVNGLSKRSGFDIQVQVSTALERLSKELEQAFFLILQEALSNVVRHSGCRTALVCLETKGDRVVMRVQDSGRGMVDDQVTTGVGIPSMRERLRQVGGSLEIQSSSKGTTVIASAPLRPHGADPS